ncbi:MAG: hypothetical protein QW461_10820 [Candidatus Jordarchaeales archaeon]
METYRSNEVTVAVSSKPTVMEEREGADVLTMLFEYIPLILGVAVLVTVLGMLRRGRD